MLTADAILAMKSAGDLFSEDLTKLKEEYKALSKQWHPDTHSDPALATKVMTVINRLKTEGESLLRNGSWSKSNYIDLSALDGRRFKVNFLKEFSFELGKGYICRASLIYVVAKEHKSFYDNFLRQVANFKFHDSDMEKEFKKYLPRVKESFETADSLVLIIDKPTDVFSLRDILDHYKGEIPDRHVAWILSTLYNTACFLHYNKLSHNGITVDNYFICPEHHSGMLLGGWFYTVPQGEKMSGAPTAVFNIMSMKTKTNKLGTYETDMDSIRQLGRELLGDKAGVKLRTSKTVPSAITDWLLGSSSLMPMKEYAAWGETLTKGYGARKFVVMDITKEMLYTN